MRMMKAAVWYGGKDVRIEDVPEPRLNEHEVLIRVKSVGICGSDAHAFEGKSKRRVPPLIMGHEFAGIVADIGSEVSEFQNGDRIVVEPIISCGVCEPCSIGKSSICTKVKVVGLHTPGAFAEYVAVPARKCYKLPDNVSFDEGALMEPLAVGMRAVNITPTNVSDDVLVIGSGTIGLMVLQVAKHRVGGKVFVSDLIDHKLALAKRLGADETIDIRRENLIDRIHELTGGRGIDVVIEAVGIQDTVHQALAAVKRGGEVTIAGLFEPIIQIDMIRIVPSELTIRGSYSYSGLDFKKSLDLAANGRVQLKPLITHTFPLGEVRKAVDVITDGKEKHIKILLRP